MNQSDLRNKVAELLVIRSSGYPLDSLRQYPNWELTNQELKRLLGEGVGGVILYGGSVQDIKNRTKQLQTWTKKSILFCADIEEGVGQRFKGGTWFVPPMALGLLYSKEPKEAILLAEKYGQCLGEQAVRCGLNWVLAPVCDINTNPLNPVINMRAWGQSPNSVAKLVCAFNKGLVSTGVLSCAKHFPGHGDTQVDSHLSLPVLEHSLDRLDERELVPFKALIRQGVNSVMTAHLLLKQIDHDFPATLSKKVLSNLLRKKIGFEGLVVTDALVMKSITKKYSSGEAAVMAFEAGADLIMMPENPDQAIKALTNALNIGRISMERLHNSLERRQKELSKLNKISFNNSFNSCDLDSLEDKKSEELVNKLIKLSIVRKNKVSIGETLDGINLVRVDKLIDNEFLKANSPAINIPEKFGFKSIIYYPLGFPLFKRNSDRSLNMDVFAGKKIILQLFIRGNPFVGENCHEELWVSVIKQLQDNKQLSALIVYGSIYAWDNLSYIVDTSIPAFYSPGQMPLSQKEVLYHLFGNNIRSITTDNNKKHQIEFTN